MNSSGVPPARFLPADLEKWVIEIRRDLHAHPELSLGEERTARVVAGALGESGLEVATGVAGHGVVGLLRGKQPGPTVALRADMDALPIEEENDLPWRSRNPGVMHACGHDAHVAVMLGVARHLAAGGFAGRGPGNLKFIFQPAEEQARGAKSMIEAGVLENPRVDALAAVHVTPELPAGSVAIFSGPGLASCDYFEITLRGRGGHAGYPHRCVDPIPAAAAFISQVQSVVSRTLSPLDRAVVTIGQVTAGTAFNIIPGRVVMRGTVRAYEEEVRARVKERLFEIARGIGLSHGLEEASLEYREDCPPCVNDPRLASLFRKTARSLLGRGNVREIEPVFGAEDFSFFARERPAAFVRLGTAGPVAGRQPVHQPRFEIDESSLAPGVAFFARAATELLSDPPGWLCARGEGAPDRGNRAVKPSRISDRENAK